MIRKDALLIPISTPENIRDITMNEDAQRLHAGSSAQVMATVRNVGVAILRLVGFTSIAPGRRCSKPVPPDVSATSPKLEGSDDELGRV